MGQSFRRCPASLGYLRDNSQIELGRARMQGDCKRPLLTLRLGSLELPKNFKLAGPAAPNGAQHTREDSQGSAAVRAYGRADSDSDLLRPLQDSSQLPVHPRAATPDPPGPIPPPGARVRAFHLCERKP